jgi:hypothetical protein
VQVDATVDGEQRNQLKKSQGCQRQGLQNSILPHSLQRVWRKRRRSKQQSQKADDIENKEEGLLCFVNLDQSPE